MVLEKGVMRREKKGRVVTAKFLQYSSKSQLRFKKKNDKMMTKIIISGKRPQIQNKFGSFGPQLRSTHRKVGFLKDDKF